MKKQAFSRIEIRDILISLLVLSLVFSYPLFLTDPNVIITSLFVLGLGFIGHELSHKFVARRFGFFSEYQMWKEGLLLAIVLAVISGGNLVFAAPGAVVFSAYFIFKRPHNNEVGKIGLAGPVFNIILLYSFILIHTFLFPNEILKFAASVNGWLAIFNLIPIDPLDGGKVLKWDKKIWLTVIALSVMGFLLTLGIF